MSDRNPASYRSYDASAELIGIIPGAFLKAMKG